MAEEKRVWGIRIDPEPGPVKKGDLEVQSFKYTTHIADKRAGLFVTNSRIRQIIKDNRLKPGAMGFFHYFIAPQSKTIFFQSAYPFTRVVNVSGLTHLFEGQGIAALIELRVQRDLLKRFPGFKLKITSIILPRRRRQLEKRYGQSLDKPIEISKAFEGTLKALKSDRAIKRAEKPKLFKVRQRRKGK